MPRKAPTLAKLTRPRLHKAVARERLFVILDEARRHKSAICVVGPPGAGKTTLIASWLDARAIKGIWFQVDSGDADLATFFYYLVEAAKPFARKGQRPLPLLTPEYLQDVEGFSRRFFRELMSRLPDGATLVLDNYQEVPSGSSLHFLLVQAVAEVPAGMSIVAISRRDPPDCYARLIANSNVVLIDWDALQFTLEEAADLASTKSRVQGDLLRRIHELSDGWAAGLTLLLSDSTSMTRAEGNRPAGREALFSYFADEIFNHLPLSTREFLVTTALLSQVPVSLAFEITGNPAAADILEDLYRRHLFTHRRFAKEPVYWYHALFRDFLLSRCSNVLGANAEGRIRVRVAQTVEANADIDEAVRLYLEASEWGAAARLIEIGAESLIARGRHQTLRDWIFSIPEHILEGRERLRYWLGVSLLQMNPASARRHLELAVAKFSRERDLDHHALSAAAIIDSYFFEWSDFRPVRQWVSTLESLIDKVQLDGRTDLARRLHTSLLTGMLYVAPEHRMLPIIVRRVSRLIDDDKEPNRKISMAIILLSYCNLACDMELGRSVVERCSSLAQLPEITPLNQLWWQLRLGCHHQLSGDYDASREALDRASGLCERHGLGGASGIFLLIAGYQISTAVAQGDAKNAEAWYGRMVSMADPSRPMDAWHVGEAKVVLEIQNGNYRRVAEISERAQPHVAAAGMTYIAIEMVVNWAIGRAALGDEESCRNALARVQTLAPGTCFSHFENVGNFLQVYLCLKHGDRARGQLFLARALQSARDSQYFYPPNIRLCSIMGELLAEALQSGIETEYVEKTIRQFAIRASAQAPASWPWPLKIRVLGGCEIFCHGRRLEFSGKMPKKPLALLKCLIAFGGRDVAENRIIDALWPGEDADLSIKALDVNLVRLRKLLGQAHAVISNGDVLSLNAKLCWTDVWAFEQATDRVMHSDGDDAVDEASGLALNLYRGEFLPADAGSAWTLKMREALRSRFLRMIETIAKRIEMRGQWEAAIERYQQGLRADDLAEPFYQGLMRCYRALGRHTDAMNTYRKFRQLLSVVLGMAPSESTQALARSLQAENPAHPA